MPSHAPTLPRASLHKYTRTHTRYTHRHFCKQSRINGLCPAALHSQLHDHMCGAGLIFCVQGDFVTVHWGLEIHNQFQSLYLTKQSKSAHAHTHTKETKALPVLAQGLLSPLTQIGMDMTQKVSVKDEKRSLYPFVLLSFSTSG